jgi:hypothetical protein
MATIVEVVLLALFGLTVITAFGDVVAHLLRQGGALGPM